MYPTNFIYPNLRFNRLLAGVALCVCLYSTTNRSDLSVKGTEIATDLYSPQRLRRFEMIHGYFTPVLSRRIHLTN